jgi:hypothetical protein
MRLAEFRLLPDLLDAVAVASGLVALSGNAACRTGRNRAITAGGPGVAVGRPSAAENAGERCHP